ncbi:hypothetical protein AX774_g3096, partial [Zancudomyces culisetae]
MSMFVDLYGELLGFCMSFGELTPNQLPCLEPWLIENMKLFGCTEDVFKPIPNRAELGGLVFGNMIMVTFDWNCDEPAEFSMGRYIAIMVFLWKLSNNAGLAILHSGKGNIDKLNQGVDENQRNISKSPKSQAKNKSKTKSETTPKVMDNHNYSKALAEQYSQLKVILVSKLNKLWVANSVELVFGIAEYYESSYDNWLSLIFHPANYMLLALSSASGENKKYSRRSGSIDIKDRQRRWSASQPRGSGMLGSSPWIPPIITGGNTDMPRSSIGDGSFSAGIGGGGAGRAGNVEMEVEGLFDATQLGKYISFAKKQMKHDQISQSLDFLEVFRDKSIMFAAEVLHVVSQRLSNSLIQNSGGSGGGGGSSPTSPASSHSENKGKDVLGSKGAFYPRTFSGYSRFSKVSDIGLLRFAEIIFQYSVFEGILANGRKRQQRNETVPYLESMSPMLATATPTDVPDMYAGKPFENLVPRGSLDGANGRLQSGLSANPSYYSQYSDSSPTYASLYNQIFLYESADCSEVEFAALIGAAAMFFKSVKSHFNSEKLYTPVILRVGVALMRMLMLLAKKTDNQISPIVGKDERNQQQQQQQQQQQHYLKRERTVHESGAVSSTGALIEHWESCLYKMIEKLVLSVGKCLSSTRWQRRTGKLPKNSPFPSSPLHIPLPSPQQQQQQQQQQQSGDEVRLFNSFAHITHTNQKSISAVDALDSARLNALRNSGAVECFYGYNEDDYVELTLLCLALDVIPNAHILVPTYCDTSFLNVCFMCCKFIDSMIKHSNSMIPTTQESSTAMSGGGGGGSGSGSGSGGGSVVGSAGTTIRRDAARGMGGDFVFMNSIYFDEYKIIEKADPFLDYYHSPMFMFEQGTTFSPSFLYNKRTTTTANNNNNNNNSSSNIGNDGFSGGKNESNANNNPYGHSGLSSQFGNYSMDKGLNYTFGILGQLANALKKLN